MAIHVLKLLAKFPIARNTIELQFEKPAGFNFIPGQYGGFTLINPPEKDAGGITRRFSLLSIPDDPYIAIGTRIQNSAFKRVLSELNIDDTIKFAGPSGDFVLHEDTETPTVLLAGGIGIAPFYSMIRASLPSTRKITLFYGNPTSNDAALMNELKALEQKNSNLKCVFTLDHSEENWQGETGFISHTMIKKYVHDIENVYYYICGSPRMVTYLQELLLEMGIAEEKIKVEDFPGY